jgi:hypothetical protein
VNTVIYIHISPVTFLFYLNRILTMGRYNGTPRVDMAVINRTDLGTSNSLDDIFAWVGPTQMGEPNKPTLVQSELEFTQKFGGDLASSNFPKLCKRALKGGAKLLVSRVVHSDANGDYTGSKAESGNFEAKSLGTWGNSLVVKTSLDARGNVVLSVLLGGSTVESYTISGTPTASEVEVANAFLRYVSIKPSGVGQAIASGQTIILASGTDTGTIVASDYLGVQEDKTGLFAFDEVQGIKFLSCPDIALNEVDRAIVDYCEMRNIIALLRTPLGITGDLAVKYRSCQAPYSGQPIDSYQAFMFTGGVKTVDSNGLIVELSELADVAIAIGKKNKFGKVWNAFSVQPYSLIEEAVGVVYNLDIPSRQSESDLVYDAGLNAVIQDDSKAIMLWGDFTMQSAFSALSFTGNVELLQDIFANTKPVFRKYIGKLNDIPTWRNLHQAIRVIMDRYKTEGGIYDYKYFGDQDVDKIEFIKVNKIEDVNVGIYKVVLEIQFKATMRYIRVELIASMQGIRFTILN